MTIAEAYRRVEIFIDDLDMIISVILSDLDEDMIQLNRDQLWIGIRSDESNIEPEYRIFTQIEKEKKGQPIDRVTLYDTGSFYNKIFTAQKGDVIEFNSSDSKTGELVQKYGEGIFGLTDKNLTVIHIKAMDELIRTFKQYTNF